MRYKGNEMTRLFIERPIYDDNVEGQIRELMRADLNTEIGKHLTLDTRYTVLIIEENTKRTADGYRLVRYSAEVYAL